MALSLQDIGLAELLGDKLAKEFNGLFEPRTPGIAAVESDEIAASALRRKKRARGDAHAGNMSPFEQLNGINSLRQLAPQDETALVPGQANPFREELDERFAHSGHLLAILFAQASKVTLVQRGGVKP